MNLQKIFNGADTFYRNSKGEAHREDGPAVEYGDGSKIWFINNNRHREDGPAVEYASGHKEWRVNDRLHREDGPAIEQPNGHKAWWLNGKLHRTDGPAVEYPNGTKEWWLNDVEYSEEDYYNQIKALKASRKGSRQAGLNLDI